MMNAYIPAGRTIAKIAVPLSNTEWVMRSTGTRDARTVKQMQAMVRELGRRGARAWDVLTKVGTREWSLMDLYERYAAHRGDLTALRGELATVRLVDRQAAFLAHVASRRAADTAQHYGAYLTALLAAGFTTAADLTVPRLSRWLDGLPGSSGTRRKYAAGVSAFCAWLVREGALPANPMRDVPKPKPGKARVSFLDERTMQQLVEAMPSPAREVSALIHGTGLDVSVALALTVDAVDVTTWGIASARTKTGRRHSLLVAEWARPYVKRLLAGKLGRAPLVEGLDRWRLRDAHASACQALGISNYWLRDARHSWAVRFARAGGTPAQGAEQLGHGDGGVLFLKVYGPYVPTLAERQVVETRASRGTGSGTG